MKTYKFIIILFLLYFVTLEIGYKNIIDENKFYTFNISFEKQFIYNEDVRFKITIQNIINNNLASDWNVKIFYEAESNDFYTYRRNLQLEKIKGENNSFDRMKFFSQTDKNSKIIFTGKTDKTGVCQSSIFLKADFLSLPPEYKLTQKLKIEISNDKFNKQFFTSPLKINQPVVIQNNYNNSINELSNFFKNLKSNYSVFKKLVLISLLCFFYIIFILKIENNYIRIIYLVTIYLLLFLTYNRMTSYNHSFYFDEMVLIDYIIIILSIGLLYKFPTSLFLNKKELILFLALFLIFILGMFFAPIFIKFAFLIILASIAFSNWELLKLCFASALIIFILTKLILLDIITRL